MELVYPKYYNVNRADVSIAVGTSWSYVLVGAMEYLSQFSD